MKIVVINGYGTNETGKKSFEHFESLIRKLFLKAARTGLIEPTFTILDAESIGEYVFKGNSDFLNYEAKSRFDTIDFVFIDGDANMLPWMQKASNFGYFFKQCKQCNKCLFAAGFGFYMLIYYCATNYANFKVINGRGWGNKLEAIQNLKVDNLKPNANFLDNETGDVYSYNPDSNQWIPIANTGLHYTRNVSTSKTGQFVQSVKIFRGKLRINGVNDLFKSKLTESVCYIKKQFVMHWAFAGLPHKFMVPTKNVWDAHPVNITDIGVIESNYVTLADYDNGPLVIEHKNTLAIMFHVDPKYQNTLNIVDNFIKKKIIEIVEKGRVDIPIEFAILKERKAATFRNLSEIGSRENIGHGRIGPKMKSKNGYTTEFKRCGYSYSKRLDLLVVDNNAMGSKIYVSGKYSKNVHKTQRAESHRIKTGLAPGIEASLHSETTSSAQDIHKILPSQENIVEEQKNYSRNYGSRTIKSSSSKTIGITPYSIRNKKTNRKWDFDVIPSITRSGPYETEAERKLKEMRLSRVKWVNPTDFRTVFPLSSNLAERNNEANSVSDLYRAPMTVVPRPTNKTKWVGGTFYLN